MVDSEVRGALESNVTYCIWGYATGMETTGGSCWGAVVSNLKLGTLANNVTYCIWECVIGRKIAERSYKKWLGALSGDSWPNLKLGTSRGNQGRMSLVR